MFTKDGISALHGWTHESLDVLLRHVSSIPDGVLHNPIAGFGFPAIWSEDSSLYTASRCDPYVSPQVKSWQCSARWAIRRQIPIFSAMKLLRLDGSHLP